MFINKIQPKGFTLIELIVVIGILVTGMVAAQTTIQYGVRAATRSMDQVVAAHLAEEGLELVRNIRDTNWAIRANGGANAAWTDLDAGTYQIHYLLTSPSGPFPGKRLCPTTTCSVAPLNFDPNTKLYGYASWPSYPNSGAPQSRFTRIVTTAFPSSEYINVSSQVSWSDSAGQHQVTLVEHLYDWRP